MQDLHTLFILSKPACHCLCVCILQNLRHIFRHKPGFTIYLNKPDLAKIFNINANTGSWDALLAWLACLTLVAAFLRCFHLIIFLNPKLYSISFFDKEQKVFL